MEPGLVPVGQQEARCRGKKGMGEAGRIWRCQGEVPWAEGQRGREGSQPARARLPLHVEHMGRVPVLPVLEVGVAWALQLQDVVFPWFLQVLLIRSCMNSVLMRWARMQEGMGLACPRPRLPVSHVLHQPLLAEQLSIPLQGTVSERVCPQGPGVLLREALGAKAYCLGGGGGVWGSMARGQGLLLFPLRGLSPAETKAEALPTGVDLVLGFYVYEAPCILTISTQHPVSHGHAGLQSFTSRTE